MSVDEVVGDMGCEMEGTAGGEGVLEGRWGCEKRDGGKQSGRSRVAGK